MQYKEILSHTMYLMQARNYGPWDNDMFHWYVSDKI